MTAQDKLDEGFTRVGQEVKSNTSRIVTLEGQPKIGVLLSTDPNPTTPGFWFRETS